MSYILKRCGPAGGLQSFVQQSIFNGASHEQEPYGPRQEKERQREKERWRDECRRGVMGWWNGEGGEKRVEKEGEREVQVRQAVIDWCFVFEVPQRSCKTTGYLEERWRFRLRLHPDWLYTTLFKVLACFFVLEGGGWNEDNIIVVGLICK